MEHLHTSSSFPFGDDIMIKLMPYRDDKIWGYELWLVSAYKDKSSTVIYDDKPYDFGSFYNDHKDLFGKVAYDKFPLIIKKIVANDDLSIQVHPTQEVALKYGDDSKTESWIILDETTSNDIIYGHQASNEEEAKQYIKNKDYDAFINRIPIQAGDVLTIHPGTIHAIKANTSILEVQEAADTTYRFYDYDRVRDGSKRPLHTKKALETLQIPDQTVSRETNVSCYNISQISISDSYSSKADERGCFIYITSGHGKLNGESVTKDDLYFIPVNETYTLIGNMTCVQITIQ